MNARERRADGRMRVYELAGELWEPSSARILVVLRELGEEVRSASTLIDKSVAQRVRDWLRNKPETNRHYVPRRQGPLQATLSSHRTSQLRPGHPATEGARLASLTSGHQASTRSARSGVGWNCSPLAGRRSATWRESAASRNIRLITCDASGTPALTPRNAAGQVPRTYAWPSPQPARSGPV
jgi:hypothetical protein